MSVQFGTDGVRGVANADITPEVALALGRAAARVLGQEWVVGRDTRVSGHMLEAAFAAGVCAEGGTVWRLGVIPTPGVAVVAAHLAVPGASITASHNTFEYNGIKIIGPGGVKLSDEDEARVEASCNELLDRSALASVRGESARAEAGPASDRTDLSDHYLDWLVSRVPSSAIAGLRVVLDCANGAASTTAPAVFERLGATLTVIHAEPDGYNINAGSGSTDTAALEEMMRAGGFDAGFAFDGDADRLVAVDERGTVVDGDMVMAMLALDRHGRQALPGNRIVVTEWSNLGLLRAMAEHHIDVSVTSVGDRFVLQELDRSGAVLGGEQSGHIIFRDLAPTGDGCLTALQVAELLSRRGAPLGELAGAAMTRLPQRYAVVGVRNPPSAVAKRLRDDVAAENERLAGQGRLVVRASGTEPVVRILAEAETEHDASELVERFSALAREHDGDALASR